MDFSLACRCCGGLARWCDEGPDKCGTDGCDHIHCDHCGMHYSLENSDFWEDESKTIKEMKARMKKAYLGARFVSRS